MFSPLNTSKLSHLILKDIQIPEATPHSLQVFQDKIRGVIFGNALGDALGVRTEFFSSTSAKNIWKSENLQLDDWPEYNRPFPRNDWTDDTDQMILILQSFLSSGSVDPKDFARRLLTWKNHGFPELGDTIGLGIGSTVNSVLNHPDYLQEPFLASFEIWENS
jgi:ADP-ribosylglycohydrolase